MHKPIADLIYRVAVAARRDPAAMDSDALGTAARLLGDTGTDAPYQPTDRTRWAALRLAVAACAVAAGVGTLADVRAAVADLEAARRPRLSIVH